MKDFSQGPKLMPQRLSPQPAKHPSANPVRNGPHTNGVGQCRCCPVCRVCGWGKLRKSKAKPPCCHPAPALPSSVADITAAALATGACIVGILCLPLILLLIYKQRQAVSSRRTYPPLASCQRGTPVLSPGLHQGGLYGMGCIPPGESMGLAALSPMGTR